MASRAVAIPKIILQSGLVIYTRKAGGSWFLEKNHAASLAGFEKRIPKMKNEFCKGEIKDDKGSELCNNEVCFSDNSDNPKVWGGKNNAF